MKTIIAGSRGIINRQEVWNAIKAARMEITEVVCGCADGPDKLGYEWAREKQILVRFFPAWGAQRAWALVHCDKHGHEVVELLPFVRHSKSAGHARNAAMAKYADALIAVYDGESRGTRGMIELAVSLNMPTFVMTKSSNADPLMVRLRTVRVSRFQMCDHCGKKYEEHWESVMPGVARGCLGELLRIV